MREHIGRWFCRHFHHRITRPICGKYHCLVCLRAFNVPWDETRVTFEIDELERLYKSK